ncbi:MAG: MupA/Atu3671 family FMN-dependent luciferase-like monooxygenase, partial [Cyanobacteria bacterium J06626_23]
MSAPTMGQKQPQTPGQAMQFGLMFFASGEASADQDKYRLVIESAKFADQHGFSSVWVPERHFTALGCLYPNPAVLQAALAQETQRVRLQAGSVVLPLHHPIRVAEEWAMVDNLSGGRVGVSFASGWNPSDFAFFPERYAHRYQEMYQGIEQVQKLWRGESISIARGDGDHQDVRIYPTPIQPDLPIWVTAASNPQTFIKAGELGANLLTHLFDQEVEVLAEKIALYRQARLQHGHDPEAGQVTATLHTFVGEDLDVVQAQVRSPYCDYLKSNINLLQGLGYSRGINVSVETLSPQDLDSATTLVFEKFFHDRRALLGTPESCIDLVRQLRQIGVDEIACLLDFGPDAELILENLPHLDRLRRACAELVDDPAAQPPLDLARSLPSLTSLPQNHSLKQLPNTQTITGSALDGSLDDIRSRCRQEVTGATFYDRIQAQGIELGTSFQGIVQLWRGDREALGNIQRPNSLASESAGYGVHPALLDTCLQVFFATIPTDGESLQGQYLPASLGHLQLAGALGDGELWSHAVLRSEAAVGASAYEGDVRILDETGHVVMQVTGLRLQQALAEQSARAAATDIKDWFYGVEWHPYMLPTQETPPAPDYLLPPSDIVQQVYRQMAQHDGWAPLAIYDSLFPKLEALSASYILWACHQMGIELHQGQRLSVASINQEVKVVSAHQRLLRRLLQILQQAGFCQPITSETWEVCQEVTPNDPQAIWRSLLADYPQCSAELDLLGHCGQQLAAVLQGQTDPLQLLFPEGSLASVERLYQDAPGSRVANQLVQQAITVALAQLPRDRAVRILEIGAGTGGTTTSVLPQLPAERTEYHFTDVSYLFMAKAEQKFQDYPFVQYRILDIEQEPQAQGFDGQYYDLILAANVLHATADITQTLVNVKQLLAPGGLLILLEGTQPQAWVDLIFGLTEGWWKFTDTTLRPDSALLNVDQWQGLLQTLDFAPVEAITAETEALAQQAVIVASGPDSSLPEQAANHLDHGNVSNSPPEQWLVFADDTGIGHQLAELLRAQGDRCVLAVPGDAYEVITADQIQLNPHRPDDFQRLFAELSECDAGNWRGVIYLWGLYAAATQMTLTVLESASHWVAQSPLHLVHAIADQLLFEHTRFWWVTQGAHQIAEMPQPAGQPGLAVAQSMLWGLGRVLAVEQPQQWGGMVDLDLQSSTHDAAKQATEVLRVIQAGNRGDSAIDDHLAFRQGQCYSAQLAPHSAQLASMSDYSWQADASYLITGGLGDLGLFVADWMVQQGARHLILLGRSPLPPRSEWPMMAAKTESPTAKRIRAIQDIERQGATVYLAYADVADEGQMAAAIAAVQQQGCPSIRGVF